MALAAPSLRPYASLAIAAARHRAPLFTPVHKVVKRAGVVTFKLKLSKAAKKIYKRKHKLTLKPRVTFKPKGGGHAIMKIHKITLRHSTCPKRAVAPRRCK
jgi:hypothetical protein